MQSTKCLWLSGLSPKIRPGDIESEVMSVLQARRQRFEVRYTPAECNFALVHFDSLRDSEFCRNKLRGRVFPGTTERVRCDYYEPRKFKFYPGYTNAKKSTTGGVVGGATKRKQSRSSRSNDSRSTSHNSQRDSSDYDRER